MTGKTNKALCIPAESQTNRQSDGWFALHRCTPNTVGYVISKVCHITYTQDCMKLATVTVNPNLVGITAITNFLPLNRIERPAEIAVASLSTFRYIEPNLTFVSVTMLVKLFTKWRGSSNNKRHLDGTKWKRNALRWACTKFNSPDGASYTGSNEPQSYFQDKQTRLHTL